MLAGGAFGKAVKDFVDGLEVTDGQAATLHELTERLFARLERFGASDKKRVRQLLRLFWWNYRTGQRPEWARRCGLLYRVCKLATDGWGDIERHGNSDLVQLLSCDRSFRERTKKPIICNMSCNEFHHSPKVNSEDRVGPRGR